VIVAVGASIVAPLAGPFDPSTVELDAAALPPAERDRTGGDGASDIGRDRDDLEPLWTIGSATAADPPSPAANRPSPRVEASVDLREPAAVIPFGSRPESGALAFWGGCPSVIEGRTFRDLGPGVIAIHLEGCSDVVIRDNDFINVAEGIYVLGGSNVRVVGNRFQNILGPSIRDGGIHGNFVMFNQVEGGLIQGNSGRCGDTEDTISLYRSSNVAVISNRLEGALEDTPGCLAWRSASGTGINVNDTGGNGNVVRYNTLVNPHRVGIGVAGGSNTAVEYNTVYGSHGGDHELAFGIAVENYSNAPCSNITIRANRVYWRLSTGLMAPVWDGRTCGKLLGRQTRRVDRTLDPKALAVTLPLPDRPLPQGLRRLE
jgi:parallel beta-helix repeat protein